LSFKGNKPVPGTPYTFDVAKALGLVMLEDNVNKGLQSGDAAGILAIKKRQKQFPLS